MGWTGLSIIATASRRISMTSRIRPANVDVPQVSVAGVSQNGVFGDFEGGITHCSHHCSQICRWPWSFSNFGSRAWHSSTCSLESRVMNIYRTCPSSRASAVRFSSEQLAGIPTFVVRKDTGNSLLRDILAETHSVRASRRYTGYVPCSELGISPGAVRILRAMPAI
jgi:hypothetical protein